MKKKLNEHYIVLGATNNHKPQIKQTSLQLKKIMGFSKTNTVSSRTERHPYSLAGLDEMKKKTNEHYIVLGAMNISF